MWHMSDGWGWWMVVGWVWMLIFWGLIIWAVIAFTRRGIRGGAGPAEPERGDAVEVLRRRYASGELSEEEFRQRRRVLEENGSGHPS